MATRGRPKGLPKTGGRTKGTLNKITLTVQEKLDSLDCDPLAGMVRIAKQAEAMGDAQLAGNMYKELAQYVAPKRKAIEHTGQDGEAIKHQVNIAPALTPEQWAEAFGNKAV